MKEFINGTRNNGIDDTIKYVRYNGQKYIVDGHHRAIAAKNWELKRF
ncbi:MAG: hypothetical protein HDR01_10790 [Lachnospiraceae bacterium]|nr:hypothetical protein [Lachnospiraceae bacterium]